MAFNDLAFLFIFFPAALLLHALMPMPGKNVLLLILSLVFFAWGSPSYVVLLLLLLVFNYFSGLLIGEYKAENAQKKAKFALTSAVVVNLLLLGFFKYWGFVLENVNALLHLSLPVQKMSMPVGVSFFTFSILSYLFDVYRDKAPAAKNPITFGLFVAFFPKLVSGPIVPWRTMEAQIRERKPNQAKFGSGSRLFLIGLAKKVLLANTLGNTFYALLALPKSGISVASAWLGTLTYALMLYFDFGGYSDMAIGLAQMFGFTFEKNFDYPYLSTSITEFWRRWHISLGAWFRDYVYIPLGGSREGDKKTMRNLLIVWLLTGLWHGASWNFVAWGLYYGLLLLLEKFVLKSFLEKLSPYVKLPVTFLLVLIGWVFFFSPSLGSALMWLGRMFGIGAAGLVDATAKFYFSGSWKILLISLFGAFPLGTQLGNRVYHAGKNAVVLSVIWFAILFLLCLAGMMSSTYSSFLYFQF